MCETETVPVTAPRSCDRPSPQLTVTLRIALPLVVAGVTANVNDAGSPALGGVVGPVMMSVGAPLTLTVTVPDAWPEVAGVVGVVGVPVAGGVLEPACAPTAAVTVACDDVLRIVVAVPL